LFLFEHGDATRGADETVNPRESGNQVVWVHIRFIYKGDTSTHAQGTDPKMALGSHSLFLFEHGDAIRGEGRDMSNIYPPSQQGPIELFRLYRRRLVCPPPDGVRPRSD